MMLKRLLIVSAGVISLLSGACVKSTCPCDSGDVQDLQEGLRLQDSEEPSGDVEDSKLVDVALHQEIPDNAFYFEVGSVEAQRLEILVKAKGIKGVSALALSILYKPSDLEVQEIQVQDIFDEATGAGVFRGVKVPDGRISIGGAYYGLKRQRDLNNTTLARIIFKVKHSGESYLAFMPADTLVLARNRSTVKVNLVNSTLRYNQP